MNKAYTRINWQNEPSTATPLDEINLNKVDLALNTVDDRIVSFDTSKANQSDLLQSIKDITYNSTTGKFVFTKWNNTTVEADINVEKIPVSFSMDENGVIKMVTEDGTEYTADVSTLLKDYDFADSATVQFNKIVTAKGYEVTAEVIDGSITASKLQPNYLADVQTASQNAINAAASASSDALVSEGYANGTENGIDVPTTSPYFHNNARYWKEQAQAVTNLSLDGLTNVNISNPTMGQSLVYNSDSNNWENGDSALPISVIDNLMSTNPSDALSANQGRILNNKIEGLPNGARLSYEIISTWT